MDSDQVVTLSQVAGAMDYLDTLEEEAEVQKQAGWGKEGYLGYYHYSLKMLHIFKRLHPPTCVLV